VASSSCGSTRAEDGDHARRGSPRLRRTSQGKVRCRGARFPLKPGIARRRSRGSPVLGPTSHSPERGPRSVVFGSARQESQGDRTRSLRGIAERPTPARGSVSRRHPGVGVLRQTLPRTSGAAGWISPSGGDSLPPSAPWQAAGAAPSGARAPEIGAPRKARQRYGSPSSDTRIVRGRLGSQIVGSSEKLPTTHLRSNHVAAPGRNLFLAGPLRGLAGFDFRVLPRGPKRCHRKTRERSRR
jgi:hypothetical protein